MGENLVDQAKRAMKKDGITPKKIVAFIVFGLIVVVFTFWGVNNPGMGGGAQVAQVNNTLINLAQLDREQKRIEQFYNQMFGGAVDLSAQRQLLLQEAVQNLVNTELISQAAKDEGIGATNQEVRNFILQDFTVFQENGVFQRDRYFQFLQANRFAPADFEELIRKDIEGQRTRRAFEWTAWPNSLEREKAEKMQSVQMTISYITLNPREMEEQIKIADSQVKAALANPEFVKRVEGEFKARKVQLDQPEQVRAQHILIRFEAGNSASESQALDKAQKLRAQATAANFGTLAEKNSDDPGSKNKKGDLGYFPRGQMVSEFDQAVFNMKEGEISQPVKTQFGYHIIKLNDRKPAQEAQFENHKHKLAETLLSRDLINEEIQKIQEVFQSGQENAWMKKLQVSWKDSGSFNLGSDNIPGISSEVVADTVDELIAAPEKVQVVSDGDIQYVVKMKDIKSTSSSETFNAESWARIKATQAFEGWVQDYRKASTVEINPSVLQL